MGTHSSILAWEIPGTEEHGGPVSTGPRRVGTRQQWCIHTGGREELCQPMAAEPNRKTNPFFPGKDSIITLPTSFQFSSVTQSCPTLCDPMKHIARRASLSITKSQSPPKPISIVSVMPSNHLILCHPLLLPSIFQHWGLFK